MPDLLSWSTLLFRWGRTQVRLHSVFLIFATYYLLTTFIDPDQGPHALLEAVGVLALLAVALLAHERAEWFVACRLDLPAEPICLWPLGNFVLPGTSQATRGADRLVAIAAGLATSAFLCLVSSTVLIAIGGRPVWDPFREAAAELWSFNPFRMQPRPAALSAAWLLGWFAHVNWILFIANLIPALPFDAGRMARGFLSRGYRDREISPYVARVCSGILILVGLFRLAFLKPGGMLLILLALLIEWLVRQEAHLLEENGYFEEGAFGYDFSQGYTSLDTGQPRVRPQREGALQRWRRRQSDQRRIRGERRLAAETARLDEILAKLHGQGKTALTGEEQRFLARVSRKLRNRKH